MNSAVGGKVGPTPRQMERFDDGHLIHNFEANGIDVLHLDAFNFSGKRFQFDDGFQIARRA